MEMQQKHVMMKEKMEVFGLVKEALTIPYKNTYFIIFALLTSLPLLCFMVVYEVIFQKTLIEASNILEPPYSYFYRNWPVPTYLGHRFSKDFCLNLIQLCFLYLVPLPLMELFTITLTLNLASKMHKGQTSSMTTPTQMLHETMKEARLKAPLITYVYALFLSTCTILGLIWLVTNYFFISRNIFYGYYFVIFYAAAFVALLTKYLEWSAVWNMSVVISVVEGTYGAEALALSDYFSRDCRRRGLLLMLVFFVWSFGLRLPCLCVGCYEGAGVIPLVGLLWVGNMVKWVVCMLFFYDCGGQISEQAAVVGKEAEAVDAEETFTTSESPKKKIDGQTKPESEAPGV